MKIDVTQILKNYEGLPMYEEQVKRDNEGKTVKDKGNPVFEDVKLTLRSVLNTALMANEADKARTVDDKNIARPILNKLWKNKDVDFTTKDGGYIIEKVGLFFNPLVLERVESILDGKDDNKDGKKEDK